MDKLTPFALITVAVGALIGIVASLLSWAMHDHFATTTFVMSLLALAAAYPVWRNYRHQQSQA